MPSELPISHIHAPSEQVQPRIEPMGRDPPTRCMPTAFFAVTKLPTSPKPLIVTRPGHDFAAMGVADVHGIVVLIAATLQASLEA